MGMTIETARRNLSMYDVNECGNAELHTWYKGIEEDMEESFKVAIDTMRRYQMIELDHKADMAGMLEELKAEIKHFMLDINPSSSESDYACNHMITSIQQRIDALKGEQA